MEIKARNPSRFRELVSNSTLANLALKRLIALEMIAVFFGSLAVSVVRLDVSLAEVFTNYPGFPKVFIFPMAWYFCLYRTHSWDRSILHVSNDYYVRALKASGYALITFTTFAFITKYSISRLWVFWNALVITILILAIRYFVRLIFFKRAKKPFELTYIYLGVKGSEVEAKVDFESVYGFSPNIHVLEPPQSEQVDDWLDAYELLSLEIDAYGVIVGVGQIQDASLIRRLADSKRSQIIDFVLATKIGAISNRFERLESPKLVRIRESSIVTGGAVVKRLFDILMSFVALIALLPLFAILSILVKVTSSGRIFYVDRRVGKDGTLFNMPKFRSMYEGADEIRLAVLGKPDGNMIERYRSDPRITPLGKFMRRWSLDEIPQFWCVLTGDMSLVGPRPVLKEELDLIQGQFQLRFMAKPGLTGLWQVTGRKELPWRDRMIRDIAYIDNWSFSYDLVLIAKTVIAILKGEGAH